MCEAAEVSIFLEFQEFFALKIWGRRQSFLVSFIILSCKWVVNIKLFPKLTCIKKIFHSWQHCHLFEAILLQILALETELNSWHATKFNKTNFPFCAFSDALIHRSISKTVPWKCNKNTTYQLVYSNSVTQCSQLKDQFCKLYQKCTF